MLSFASQRDFDAWLEEHHETAQGLWLKIARKTTDIASVSYDEALESALCFGWIDGQKQRADDQHWLQRFTPRSARSKWSQINCRRATELLDSGRMRPAGAAEIDRAKADGRWDAAYSSQSNATVPPDLAAALDAEPTAREFFATLDAQSRYAILYRINDAKKPQTRAARIEKYVVMLKENETIHPRRSERP